MLRQVMLDAKLTLFAVLLSVAISSPAGDGANIDVPDYVVITVACRKETSLQGWFTLTPQPRHNPRELTGLDPEDDKRRGMVILWPAPPGTWTLRMNTDVESLTIATRDRYYAPRRVTAGTQLTFRTK